MSLTKKQRDALPASDFAVPETRDLPMQDKNHVRMAWQMVDKTKDLTPEQREQAKKRILERAKKFGMDTSDWDVPANMQADDEKQNQEMEKEQEEHEQRQEEIKGEAYVFSALAMEIPEENAEHPNKVPFKGVLTRVDEPSDNPLGGSHGKRVILPKNVAEKSLSTLLGMAIDHTANMDGHDVRNKIGIITAATVVGNEIHIEGFFYGADFPDEIKRIQAEKSLLGFSYEAKVNIRSLNDDPLVIKDCAFTGAAVLYKNKAAYTTTSLSANMENQPMTPEEKKLLEDVQAQVAALSTKLAAAEEKLTVAGGSVMHMVKPHADKLRACADGMEAAGMGMHAKQGHVAMLHGMADSMEADAAVGKLPHIYQTSDFYNASKEIKTDVSAAANDATNAEIKKLSEIISDLTTKVGDLQGQRFEAATAPERKTISPEIKTLLAKSGLDVSEGKKLSHKQVEEMGNGLSIAKRIEMKMNLEAAGLIA